MLAEWRAQCLGLLWSRIRTWEVGRPHCWAVAIVLDVCSGEQTSSLA